jgi:phosphoribosyl-AMP cyclohydrolase
LISPIYSFPETITTSLIPQIDFLDAFTGCLKTDRVDGMFTTVVCDDHGVCLGLVYSNKESVRIAFLERRGVYWSRSRAALWRKGESSGMYQELLDMRYDCDRDALRFTVVQHGNPPAFCHLMTRNCWGQEQVAILNMLILILNCF